MGGPKKSGGVEFLLEKNKYDFFFEILKMDYFNANRKINFPTFEIRENKSLRNV